MEEIICYETVKQIEAGCGVGGRHPFERNALPLNMGKLRTSRIRFSRGRTTAIRKGKIGESGNDLYLVRAKAGQTMIVHITSKQGNAVFDIIEPPPGSGTPFVRESKDWTDKLERSGDYRISVYGLGGAVTNYSLEVTVR